MQQLQPPGSGLPDLERLFVKYVLVPAVRVFITWDIALWLLRREIAIITKLVSALDESERTRQVVIDRTFAIEDDSRRYSVNMVLEHLGIVAAAEIPLITMLSNEQPFERELTIEGVKPHANETGQLDAFLKINAKYVDSIKKLPKKQSRTTKRHPWFLEFNNSDWHRFTYMHTFIHRRQIEAIIQKLGGSHE